MGTDTALQGETEAHITTGQWQRMERLIAEVHDALLGTMDRPGAGVLVRLETLERRMAATEKLAEARDAGWAQAKWIVLSVALSSATAWVVSTLAAAVK